MIQTWTPFIFEKITPSVICKISGAQTNASQLHPLAPRAGDWVGANLGWMEWIQVTSKSPSKCVQKKWKGKLPIQLLLEILMIRNIALKKTQPLVIGIYIFLLLFGYITVVLHVKKVLQFWLSRSLMVALALLGSHKYLLPSETASRESFISLASQTQNLCKTRPYCPNKIVQTKTSYLYLFGTWQIKKCNVSLEICPP